MSNQYSRFGRDPQAGTVLDDIVTTESMIRSTDFQQKLAAARVMREKVMQQRERDAALARRQDHGERPVGSPSFIRSSSRPSVCEFEHASLDAPRRPRHGPSFHLIAEAEPVEAPAGIRPSGIPINIQRVQAGVATSAQLGVAATKDAAEWAKSKAMKVREHAPSMAQSKETAGRMIAQIGGVSVVGRQSGRKLVTEMAGAGRTSFAKLTGALSSYSTLLSAKNEEDSEGRPVPYMFVAAGLVGLLGVGLVIWSLNGSPSALAKLQAKPLPADAPVVPDTATAFDVPGFERPPVTAVGRDRPTPQLAAYDFASASTGSFTVANIDGARADVGPVAVGSAPATAAWVPAPRFETQVAQALSLVSRSGFEPGSLPNSTIVSGDTPRLKPIATQSSKYAVKRSLRPLPRQ